MRAVLQVFEAEHMLLSAEEMVEAVIVVGVELTPNAEVAEMRGVRHEERVVFASS
jgi:hypothetical protein